MMALHFPSHNRLAVPLLLNNREVAAAMNAGEYVETMEEAFRELGAGRAVNSLRVDTCLPLEGYTPALKQSTQAHIDELPLDADPVYAPATMAAAKQAGDTTYRLKTITERLALNVAASSSSSVPIPRCMPGCSHSRLNTGS